MVVLIVKSHIEKSLMFVIYNRLLFYYVLMFFGSQQVLSIHAGIQNISVWDFVVERFAQKAMLNME